MKILVDGQTLHTYERYRGIGRYFSQVVKKLVYLESDHTLLVVAAQEVSRRDLQEIAGPHVLFQKVNLDINNGDMQLMAIQYRQSLEDIVLRQKIDLYWNPNPLMGNVIFPGPLAGCRNVVTIHDLIPLIFPKHYLDNLPKDLFEEYIHRLTKLPLFDGIIAVSQRTKADLMAYTSVVPNKISVIYEGVGSIFFNKPEPADLSEVELRYGLPKDFIFTLGGVNYRKNNDRLIEALGILNARYRKDAHLIIAGEYDKVSREVLRSLAVQQGVADRLMFVGAVPDEDLPILYSLAGVFVFPSLYEGFGLPVLEAMAAGVPVAVSQSASIPELVGAAGLYFDPQDAEEIARKVACLLDRRDPVMLEAAVVRAKEFQWEKAAHETNQLFESLVRKPTEKVRYAPLPKNRKMRLAFFSPINPQPSGISDYSESLLLYLNEYAVIDLFVDGITPTNPEIRRDFLWIDYKQFDKSEVRDQYDHVIYHMGNNTLHDYIFSTLQRYPGITVLHDFNIHPFLREITVARGMNNAFLNEIEDSDGVLGRFLMERVQSCSYDLDIHKFPMNGKVVKKSRGIIVHSEWARRQIPAENVFVIPLGTDLEPPVTPEECNALRQSLDISKDAFVVSCFGDIVRTKRVDIILRAFSIFRIFAKNAELILVGEYYDYMKDDIQKVIKQYDLQESVRITGRVSLDRFKKFMKASDVVINLRYPTMGESSASLLRSLSYGKPVIVSDINQFREFPDDHCLKVEVGDREQDQLVSHLLRLRKNPSLRKAMEENARKYVQEHASWKTVAEKYVQVLQATAVDKNKDSAGSLGSSSDTVTLSLDVPKLGSVILEGSRADKSVVQTVAQTGTYEPHLMKHLHRTLKPSSVFLDLGANIGVFSVTASYWVGETGLVVSVEASRANFEYLDKNMRRTGFKNYRIFHLGVWDCETKMQFSYLPHQAGNSFFSTTGVRERSVETVRCRTVDSILADIGWPRVDVVKMDVEGAELKTLQGMEETITKYRPAIIFEMNNGTLKRFYGVTPDKVWDFFSRMKYSLYDFSSSENLLKISSLDEFSSLTARDQSWTELLAMSWSNLGEDAVNPDE